VTKIHRYQAACSWHGSTEGGYRAYDRTHAGSAPPANATLRLSGDPAFGGDETALNPEQLLVLAATSCQLLSFLAAAARAGVTVLDYQDSAAATMAERRPPISIDAIDLHPRITVAPGTDVGVVATLVQEAHEQCYVANTLRCEVSVTADIVVSGT
jgi:organic hydroperoxide reductase OsmC/OhrA